MGNQKSQTRQQSNKQDMDQNKRSKVENDKNQSKDRAPGKIAKQKR